MALPKVTSLAVYAYQTSGVSEIAMAVFSFTIAVLGTIGELFSRIYRMTLFGYLTTLLLRTFQNAANTHTLPYDDEKSPPKKII